MALTDSFDHPKNLLLMVKLGILNPDSDEATAFLRWGGLISDPEYFHSKKDMHEYIAGLSTAEKIALRDRVCGVAEMPERA